MSNIKVGDTVKIVDSQECYPASELLASMLKLPLYRNRGLSCMLKFVTTQAEVIAVGMHPGLSGETVLGVLCEDGGEYLIGSEGVELVSKADPRVMLGKQLFGKKIRVNPTTSRLVQEAVFAAGGKGWYFSRRRVLHTDYAYLFVDCEGLLTTRATLMNRDNYEEAVVSFTETLSIDKILPNKTEEELKKETLIKELKKSIMEASDKIKQLEEEG